MLYFKELRVTKDSNYLIVDVAVNSDTYFTNVYLDNIQIDTQDTYIDTGPSTTPIYTYSVDSSISTKNIRIVLNANKLGVNLLNNMFFIWVTARGTPDSSTPCGYDKSPIVGAAVNLYPIYQTAISYAKGVTLQDNIDRNFIDFILKLKLLMMAVRTGHNTQAITYWNSYFKTLGVQNTSCNCDG